jgi:hypothetical protein
MNNRPESNIAFGKDAIDLLLPRYPQLTLEIFQGQSNSEAYKDIVRRGHRPSVLLNRFSNNERTSLSVAQTKAGNVEVLFLPVRDDFERFIRVMAHRCEPAEIPASMGSNIILNINNWRKIEARQSEYEKAGHADWQEEFVRFTSNPSNYRDAIIVLSEGPYSAWDYKNTPYTCDQWQDISLQIRKYHEIAHYVSRRLHPENRDVLRDEVLADCIGLLAATGGYDRRLAKGVLGLLNIKGCVEGRLQNYANSTEEQTRYAERANRIIDALESLACAHAADPLEFLEVLEKTRWFIENASDQL